MMRRQVQFPQISRFFSARTAVMAEKLGLWGLLALLLTINLLNRGLVTSMSKNLRSVLMTPASSRAHIRLAMEYWDHAYFDVARRELLLANEYLRIPETQPKDSSQVLGATTSPLDILTQWQNEPVRLKNEYSFWKNVTIEKPDYKDAYLFTTIFAYQLGQPDEAKENLSVYTKLGGDSAELDGLMGLLTAAKK